MWKGEHEIINFIKKETLAQVFSCEFCEISKNTFFAEHLWTTASNHFRTIKSLKNENIRAVQDFTYLGSSIASTKRDIDIKLGKSIVCSKQTGCYMEVLLASKPKKKLFSSHFGISSCAWSYILDTHKISWKNS